MALVTGAFATPYFGYLRQAGALAGRKKETGMYTLLWIIAALLVISGVVSLVRGQILTGVLLIVVGLLVGPGGVSLFA